MKFVEHKQGVPKFQLSLIWFRCELQWWFYTRHIDNLIPNTAQHLHVNWFTSISSANSEFMEILKHWGGKDILLNISPKK
jgi:hypothetical protein